MAIDHMAYMLKYDSVHGQFPGEVTAADGEPRPDPSRASEAGPAQVFGHGSARSPPRAPGLHLAGKGAHFDQRCVWAAWGSGVRSPPPRARPAKWLRMTDP